MMKHESIYVGEPFPSDSFCRLLLLLIFRDYKNTAISANDDDDRRGGEAVEENILGLPFWLPWGEIPGATFAYCSLFGRWIA